MGPIGWPELVVLLVVVLIIFGPGKLPQIGNAIGNGLREFRKASSDLEGSVRGEKKPTAAAPAAVTTAAVAPSAAPAEPAAEAAAEPPAES